jgi:ribosomal protein L11 methyltransferase
MLRAEAVVPPRAREVVAASLLAAGALGVWERPHGVTAWFEGVDPAQPPLLSELPGLSGVPVTWRSEAPRDWQASWKATIEPVRAGRVLIVPPWLDHGLERPPASPPRPSSSETGGRPPQAWRPHALRDQPVAAGHPDRADEPVRGEFLRDELRPDELVLVIDPGQAFGTGHHATTVLCLQALDGLELAGASVADIGCGTGVLAIAAARMGAAPVVAVDLDPGAVAVAHDNVRRNGVDVAVGRGSVEVLGPTDVVVANLVTDTLVELAESLLAVTRDTLVVSGVAAERTQRVVSALEDAGGHIRSAAERDGWVALTCAPLPATTPGAAVDRAEPRR